MPFRIDPSRVTFRELRTEASILAAALGWLLLKLKVPIPSSSDLPTVEKLEPHRVHSDTLDPEVRGELDTERTAIEALGFKGTIYHRFLDTRHRTELHYASYLHKSGKAIARVTRRVFSANTPPKKYQFCTFITPLTQGRSLATSNGAGDLESPPSCLDESVVGATVSETWKRHVERMKDPAVRESIETIADGRGLLATLQTRHDKLIDYLVERRVFVPVDEEAPGEAMSPSESVETEREDGVDPLLLAEVRKLEDKRPASWGTSLLVLIGTIALFLGLGGAVWSWRVTLLLVPILLVHEAGHFLAMKMFDYRNVRMFFIPLFGAAVTGRHYDVPGWKRVVTSLMGPVPGILIGVGLGVIAMIKQQDLLMEAAVLTVILNGFNLLPSLPLDGGWVLHGLLFSRHAFLDLLSRLLGIGLLLFLAFAGGAKLMMYLAIAMGIADGRFRFVGEPGAHRLPSIDARGVPAHQ
ncbi:MAG: site-2 protease family protein, partial [Planctomycetota bacterium]